MSLSNDLVSRFAKITKDDNDNHESTVYGTVVSRNDKLYVNIDGSDSITPIVTAAEIKAGERVTVLIKDHTATVLGNITNPSASTESVGKVLDEYDAIVAKIGNFELVIADKVSTEYLEAKIAVINELIAGKATIGELDAVKATIKDLDVSKLQADIANINTALIGKAEIEDLDAANANIETLKANVATINTLIGGHLTMDNIQSLVLTSSKVTVDNAFIKDAMIDRVSASKLTAGTINTSLINIGSADGAMTITGSLQQFRDAAGNVRIQIGKDSSGDFTFALYGADGKGQLINQNGITSSAISDGLIVNSMVSDNANISGSKLDISSVVTEINNGTETIKSSKIFLDEKNQTFDVAFNKLSTTVDNIEVGGRNYIHQGRGDKQEGFFVDAKWTIAEDYAEATLTSQKTYVYISLNKGFVKGIREYEAGDVYTWSYDIMYTNWNVPDESKIGEWWLGQRYTDGTSESSTGAWRPVTQHNLPKMLSGNMELNQWIHVEYTITIPEQAHSSISYVNSVQLYYDDPDTAATITFRIKNVKLEKGNKATDWTPAPEDTDSAINTMNEKINSQTTQLSVSQGKIETLVSNTTITKENGETVSLKDDYSTFKQTVDGISSKVGSLETNYSKTLKSTKTMYYVSTSATSLSGGSWSESTPTWTPGKYIWQKLVYVYSDGTTSDGTAVCIQGAKGETGAAGANGAAGQGVSSITPQYCSHTSSTTAPTSGFVDTCPTYTADKYLWIRSKIVYVNPSDTKYTTPYYDPSWDAKNTADTTSKEVTSKMSTFQQTLDGFTTRVESVETTANSTTQRLSEITTNLDGIRLQVAEKVNYDGIISAINLSPESIQIDSSKINITGFVTFSDLSTSGSTTINGDNITTGYISGSRIKGGIITATNEINFVGGARIFGNTGQYDAGLTISAAGFSLSGGSINHLSGNWYVVDDGNFEVSNGDVTVGGDITGNVINANSAFYGNGNIALNNSYIYTPYGYGYRDYVRLGGNLIVSDSDGSGYLLILSTGGDYASFRANSGSFYSDIGCTDLYASNRVYANGVALSSDKSLKTDIRYVGLDVQGIGDNGLVAPNVNITTKDMHNFIETLPMVSYRMKRDVSNDVDYTYYGFIAQDILYTKVGSELIEEGTMDETETILDEEGKVIDTVTTTRDILKYSENKFTAFICGALQEEIKQRKALERKLNDLIDAINK